MDGPQTSLGEPPVHIQPSPITKEESLPLHIPKLSGDLIGIVIPTTSGRLEKAIITKTSEDDARK